MNLTTNEQYKIIAIHGDKRKVVTKRVGAFRATKLAAQIKAKGFQVEVKRV